MRSRLFSRLVWLTVLLAPAGAVLLGGAAWAARSGRSTALTSGTLTVSGALQGHWKLSKCTVYPVGTARYPQPAVVMYFSGSVLVEGGSGTLSMSPTRTSGTVNTEMGVAGKPPGLIHVVAGWNNCKPAG